MKWVQHVQTSDGKLHRDALRAASHAEERYQNALSKLTHPLSHCVKIADFRAYIESNLPAFLELQALKNDMVLEKSDDMNDDD